MSPPTVYFTRNFGHTAVVTNNGDMNSSIPHLWKKTIAITEIEPIFCSFYGFEAFGYVSPLLFCSHAQPFCKKFYFPLSREKEKGMKREIIKNVEQS